MGGGKETLESVMESCYNEGVNVVKAVSVDITDEKPQQD